MFELTDVRFRDILNIPSLRLEAGAITTLTGPSGGGKTTLLRLLNLLASPTSGRILCAGRDLADVDPVEHRRRVTLLTQQPVLFAGDVRENLTVGHRLRDVPAPGDGALLAALAEVRLSCSLDAPTGPLSGGERQRLALARVLLLDPAVYLMDEPSSALDPATTAEILAMLSDHVRSRGKTLVMVTHGLEEARRHSDRTLTLTDGRIAATEPA